MALEVNKSGGPMGAEITGVDCGGELELAPPNPTGRPWLPEHPEINVVTNIRVNGELVGNAGNEEMSWHSDLGYIAVPPSASLLYCIE